jgi:hypothetical protein
VRSAITATRAAYLLVDDDLADTAGQRDALIDLAGHGNRLIVDHEPREIGVGADKRLTIPTLGACVGFEERGGDTLAGHVQREVRHRCARAAMIPLRHDGRVEHLCPQHAAGQIREPRRAIRAVGIAQQVLLQRPAACIHRSCVDEHDRDAKHGTLHCRCLTAKGCWCRLELFTGSRRRTECRERDRSAQSS